jgi:hypothetical protein
MYIFSFKREVLREDGVVYGWETTMPEKRLELIAPDELGG